LLKRVFLDELIILLGVKSLSFLFLSNAFLILELLDTFLSDSPIYLKPSLLLAESRLLGVLLFLGLLKVFAIVC